MSHEKTGPNPGCSITKFFLIAQVGLVFVEFSFFLEESLTDCHLCSGQNYFRLKTIDLGCKRY